MNLKLRQLVLRFSPESWLESAKRIKKALRRRSLKKQEQFGGITPSEITTQLKKLGLSNGDSVLVHSSLSKIGFVKGGASAVIAALREAVGKEGTLLMPSFPAIGRNKEYLESGAVFDLRLTPSAMGLITETFRKMPGVIRSLHPTDPVCAQGPLAEFYTSTHFGQLTPYNEKSPFRKLAEKKGKILMLGTTLNGAGTSLHCLEDAVEFPYPVYDKKIFQVTMIDNYGEQRTMHTKVHNPAWSVKRNCDALKPIFEKELVLLNGKIGEAEAMLIDAALMLEVMIKQFNERGVTMYTPYGNNKQHS